MEGDPDLLWGRSPYLAEARSGFREGERASEGRGCFWRGTLNADRKAYRKGASPVQRSVTSWTDRSQKPAQSREDVLNLAYPSWKTQGRCRTEGLAVSPVSRFRHGSPDVGSTLGRAGIAGEVVVFVGHVRSSASLMPLAYAATQKAMSAAAGRSWYLLEVRKRSSDRFDNLGPLWGEREACRRLASRSCSRAS